MLKKILFALVGLIVILLLVSFLLPSKAKVERSLIINAPEDVVFYQVNDLQKFVKWNPWLAKDPKVQIEFGPKRAGIGANYNWKSNIAEVGSGTYKILKSDPFKLIDTKIDFLEKESSVAEEWRFTPINNGIKVSWKIEMEMGGSPIAKYQALMMDGVLGGEMESGLKQLRVICDGIVGSRDVAIAQMNNTPQGDYAPRQIDFPERHFLAARKTVAMRNMEGHMETYFAQIYDVCREKRLRMGGAHCGFYYDWNDANGTVDMAAAIPIMTPQTDFSDDIKALTIPAGKAVLVEHYGPYDQISNAHLAAQQFMQANNLSLKSPVIEEYVRDGNLEPDPSKWLTRLYFLHN